MFQIKYKLCKRATFTSNKEVYYLNIFNKEEVIKELNLYPVIKFYTINTYDIYVDSLVDKDMVSAFKKTDINLYKDLTFVEVLQMMNEFYDIKSSNTTTNLEINIIQIMQLIIANWEDWHQ